MPKFIEVNQVCRVSRRVQGEDVYEYVNDPIIINSDKILTIIPQGENCIITFPGDTDNIYVAHSALWVMGLINGKP